jgi:hypothetical protein
LNWKFRETDVELLLTYVDEYSSKE